MESHSEKENFRGTLAACTPENERATLIVMRRKQNVWITFNGAMKTTVAMTNPETAQLIDLLHAAQSIDRTEAGSAATPPSSPTAKRSRVADPRS